MITREQFIEKVNSFNLGDEQTNKCIEYYDNPSKSTSKEKVIDEASAEDLVKTVNKWYGIKNSTKEKKPRTKKVDVQGKLDELNSFVDSIIANGNEDEMNNLIAALNDASTKVGKVLEEIDKKNQEEYNNIIKAIKEFNKKNNTNYNLVNKID
jgi:hypothetical protein